MKILCSHLPFNVPSILFQIFRMSWSATGKEKNRSPFSYPILPTEICNMTFFFKSCISQINQTVEMDEDEEGAYILMLQNWVRTGTAYVVVIQFVIGVKWICNLANTICDVSLVYSSRKFITGNDDQMFKIVLNSPLVLI